MFIDVASEMFSGTELSPEEIRKYASQGLLVCNGVNISHVIEYVTEDMYTCEDIFSQRESAYDDGYEQGLAEGQFDPFDE